MGTNEPGRPAAATRFTQTPITPVFQTGVIVVGNGVILGAVVWGMKHGFAHARPIPRLFLKLEILVLGVGLLTAFPEHPRSWLYDLVRRTKKDPEGLLGWWLEHRPNIQRYVVYGLSAAVLAALISLVLDTGGVIESPYVPFLTAPALFGPLVARRGRAVLLLVVVVAVAILILGLRVHAVNGVSRSNLPKPWVYWSTAIILIATSGGISAARLDREGLMEEYIRDIELELAIGTSAEDEEPEALDSPPS
jgi:hypothetical protein